MGIFEGETDENGDLVLDGSEEVPRDPRLLPLRRGIGVLGDGGLRIGLVATDVQAWWTEKGILRKKKVDPREVVAVQMLVDVEVPEGSVYRGLDLDPVDDYFEADDPVVAGLLGGRLEHAGWELDVRWLAGVEATRAHAENAHLFDLYDD
jgi:hypothetical protein